MNTSESPPSRTATIVAFTLLCLIWGSTWLVIKGGLADLPPLTSAGIRFAVAAPVMVLVAAFLHRKEGGVRPGPRLVLVAGLLNFSTSYGLVYIAETVLPSGLVAVLWAVYPLIMAGIEHVWLPEYSIKRNQVWGFCIGLVGVGILFATDLVDLGPAAIPMAALLLLSPLVTAIAHAFIKRDGKNVSSLLLNRDGMIVGAVALLAAAWLTERGEPMTWSATAIGSIAYLAIVGTVVAFSLYFWLLRYAQASKLGVIAFVTPVIALALGAMFGGEPVTIHTLAGGGLIVGGVALAMRRASRG